jgi:hypothetical protein
MPQQVLSLTEDARAVVPLPRSKDRTDCAEPETVNFVDVEQGVAQQAELDALTAAWDGFL